MPSFELSARARLRPLVEADAKELYALIEENRSYLQPWLPWAAEQTLDRTTEFIRGAIKQEADDDGFQVALVVDGGIAGVLGYHEIDRKNRITTIGYWLAAEHQGGGLMTSAVACLTGHAFDEWRLNRVEIGVGPDNRHSRAIPERLGVPRGECPAQGGAVRRERLSGPGAVRDPGLGMAPTARP